MSRIYVPGRFVMVYRQASSKVLRQLREFGAECLKSGTPSEEIILEMKVQGWPDDFCQWYVSNLVAEGEAIELAVGGEEPKTPATKSSGFKLAAAGSVFLALWPLSDFIGIPSSILGYIAAMAFLWEGFARIAAANGKNRLLCLASTPAVFGQYALMVVWATLTEGGKLDLTEEYRQLIIGSSVSVPLALCWILFYAIGGLRAKTASRT